MAKDVVYDLDAAAFSSDDFRMYQFKVKRCPRTRPHDWTQCPFAHPGEKAKRRCPKRYRYSGTACPEFRRNGCCRRQDACPFAHGVFECWLHPSRYRTQMCTDGVGCKRRVCFFAHAEAELRKPEEDPVWLQQQMQAEMAAEHQAQQHSQALKMFSALLGQQGGGQQAGGSTGSEPAAAAGAGNNLEALLLKLLCGGGVAANPTAAAAAAPPAAAAAAGQQNLLQALQQLVQGQPQAALPAASVNPAATLLQLLGGDAGQQPAPAATQVAQPSPAQQQQQVASLLANALAGVDSNTTPEAQVVLLQQALKQQAESAAAAAPVPQQDVSQLLEALALSPPAAGQVAQPSATHLDGTGTPNSSLVAPDLHDELTADAAK